ncbi:MAG: acyl-CoA thioesterase [Deltaproteobacteria bacterium]|nr:acyl-CoA thioesterase [Deltaproteobacteria bacterium]
MKKNEVKIRVIYADTDAMGIVYHANYFRWFEIGRTELLREMGVVYAELETEGYYLPLTRSSCHYLAPARYDETIIVETTISYFRRASIKFDYSIWDEKKETVLVEGCTLHAFTSAEGKIVRAPRELVDKIKKSLS